MVFFVVGFSVSGKDQPMSRGILVLAKKTVIFDGYVLS